MPCYHPLKAFPVGVNPSGKTAYKITSYQVHHVEQYDDGRLVPMSGPGRSGYCYRYFGDWIEIPCGKCVGCRLKYSRDWANRMMLELEYHDSAYFVTLTYNDAHVPRSYFGDPATGEALPSLTLCKRDIQLFMKRLRAAHREDNIRFYMVGEYGPTTYRPHYHGILFGLHLEDLTPDGFNEMHQQYYRSPSLEAVWSVRENNYAEPQPLGFVGVGEVTWETCAYCARYITGKLFGPEAVFYETFNIEPPFTLMSRKPGIAKQWFDDHPGIYDYEFINLKTPKGGLKFRPPRYYDKLFDIEYPDQMAEIKETRKKMALLQKETKMKLSSLSYLEQLSLDERAKLAKIKALRRDDV